MILKSFSRLSTLMLWQMMTYRFYVLENGNVIVSAISFTYLISCIKVGINARWVG